MDEEQFNEMAEEFDRSVELLLEFGVNADFNLKRTRHKVAVLQQEIEGLEPLVENGKASEAQKRRFQRAVQVASQGFKVLGLWDHMATRDLGRDETAFGQLAASAETISLQAWREAGVAEQREQLRKRQAALASAPSTPAEPYASSEPRVPARAVRTVVDRTFRGMFAGDQALANTGGFRSLREFLATVNSQRADSRLQPFTEVDFRQPMAADPQQIEGDGAAGGYLVPGMYISRLMDAALEMEIVRPRADVLPMTSNYASAPFWDQLDHSANIGGLSGQWLGEGAAATSKQAKYRNINLLVKKLAIYASMSNELLEDSPDADRRLEQAMIQSIAWELDNVFLTGDGVGKPRGVLHDAALVVVAKESGQAADTIVYRNIVKMFSRLHPKSLANSVWVANATTIPQLLELFASDGTSSTHVPVLREDGNGGFTMLTRPVIFTEKLPALGDQGDLLLADFSHYVVGLRREANIQRSMHVGWETDHTAFRTILRADGIGKWNKAFTPRNGETQSWCVTLAERA